MATVGNLLLRIDSSDVQWPEPFVGADPIAAGTAATLLHASTQWSWGSLASLHMDVAVTRAARRSHLFLYVCFDDTASTGTVYALGGQTAATGVTFTVADDGAGNAELRVATDASDADAAYITFQITHKVSL